VIPPKAEQQEVGTDVCTRESGLIPKTGKCFSLVKGYPSQQGWMFRKFASWGDTRESNDLYSGSGLVPEAQAARRGSQSHRAPWEGSENL